MLQDFERGRLTGIEDINGYVARPGETRGVRVAMDAAIAEIVHEIARGEKRPAHDGLSELLASAAGSS